MKTAVLIPCYNEAKTIKKVVEDFKKALPHADIYVYDNNSTDGTAEIAKAAGAIVRYERKQGKGTFVKSLKHTRDIRKLEGFSDSCLRQGIQPGGQMLENRQVLLSDKLCASLGQPAGSQGILISRLRFADQVPVAIEKNYFPMCYLSLLGQRFDNNSLFQYLKEQEHVTVSRADKRIELCRATSEEGALLQVPSGTPMLFVKSVTYDQSGTPLYVGTQVMNGEQFSLQLTQYANH